MDIGLEKKPNPRLLLMNGYWAWEEAQPKASFNEWTWAWWRGSPRFLLMNRCGLKLKPKSKQDDEKPHVYLHTLGWPSPFQTLTHLKLALLFSICMIYLPKNINFSINFNSNFWNFNSHIKSFNRHYYIYLFICLFLKFNL